MASSYYKRTNLAIRSSFNSFFNASSTGGLILLVCAVISLLSANMSFLSPLHEIWETDLGIKAGNFSLDMSLGMWVNDALMAVFFFVVGLEIKREMMVGELSSIKQAALPIFAALGGMLMPALIYFLFNHGTPNVHGWGVPMATDIAFAVGVLSLLGNRCPLGLKVFLTALAIVDDIGAIIVLAVFYPSHALAYSYFIYAAIVLLILFLFNRARITSPAWYIVPGIFLWYFIYKSGIHATIAGVLLAMCIPSRTSINELRFSVRVGHLLNKFRETSHGNVDVLASPQQQETIHSIKKQVDAMTPLMHRFESSLSPVVTFFIMPLFALANAGVVINADTLNLSDITSVGAGIFFGLTLGKPIGIFLFSFLSVKLKMAKLPEHTRWIQILAIGVIAGIGFTMSIFIDNLAFTEQSIVDLGKITILVASMVSALFGLLYMRLTNKNINK